MCAGRVYVGQTGIHEVITSLNFATYEWVRNSVIHVAKSEVRPSKR